MELETTSFYHLPDGETVKANGDAGRAARAEADQPLGSASTTLAPLEELIVFAQKVSDDDNEDGKNHGRAYDDALEDFPRTQTWEMNEKLLQPDVATGDVDGDGRDETVFIGTETNDGFYGYLKLWVWDDPTEDFEELKYLRTHDRVEDGVVTTGDVDGDGFDEIIYAGTLSREATKLWVLDDADNDFAELETKTIYADHGTAHPWVAAGDVDGDGLDELVVSTTKGSTPGTDLWVYDDAGEDFKELKNIFIQNVGWTTHVAVGEADGDGPAEIFLNIMKNKGGSIRIFDDGTHGYADLDAFSYSGKQPSFSIGDIDGDRLDEILVVSYVTTGKNHLDARLWDDAQHDFAEIEEEGLPWEEDPEWRSTVERSNVTLGDVDCDGKDEIFIAGEGKDQYGRPDDKIKLWVIDDMGNDFTEINYWTNADRRDPTLAIGELDGDGIILEYTGEHWTTTLDPRIIVAMATPPVVEGISQNYGETGTAYGTEVSQGSGASYEVGSTAGVTVSVEAGDPFGLFEATVSASFNYEFSKTQTHTSLITYGTSYASAYPDDVVIYEALKYDNYKYKIVSHPDPEEAGKYITIDVPRESLIYKETVEHYNAHNGDNPDIGMETFKHTPGALWSYPDVVERNKLLESYVGWKSGTTPVPVGQGGGTTTVSINLAEESTTEESRTMGFEVAAGVAIGGVGFEASYGAFETEVFSVTVGEATQYEGTVGDIADSADYEKYSYSFGMFVYNFRRSDYSGYQVISYWIQDYAGPLPDRSTLAHWDFNSLSDGVARDSSSWKQEAQVYGANLSAGPRGQALCFDGVDDYVSYPNLYLTPPANLSLQFWVNLTNASRGVILYHGEHGEFQSFLREGGLWAGVKLTDEQWYEVNWTLPDLTEARWFQVTMIWEQGENLTLYIDGDRAGNVSVPDLGLYEPGSYYQPSLGVKARGRGSWSTSFFNGCLDEVSIFDRPLSEKEIKEGYSGGGDDDDDGGFLPGPGLFMVVIVASFVAVVRRRG